MSKVILPENLLSKLGPEMKMDVHWIDVKCHTGKIHSGLVVRGGKYITGHKDDPDGEGDICLSSEDIKDIRRHKLIKIWPFW